MLPEDSKKPHMKSSKNDAKEQRKPRRQNQPTACNNKPEKKVEELKATIPKPATAEPGPEFYKSLKRETDDILKISEEANSKFKKKEIRSNWAKYETPIESYDDIDEQENLGADYEKLIQTPMSIGGHFQFKHEKSWDVTTGPSPYDKYFEIDTQNLANALNCIPFHERNELDPSMFTEGDKMTMEHRSTKFKRKYYNDNSQDAIESKLLESLMKPEAKPQAISNCESQSDVNDINLEGLSINQEVTVPKEEIIEEIPESNFNSESNVHKEAKDIVASEKNEKKVEEITEIADILSAEVTSLDNKENPQIPNVSNKLNSDFTRDYLFDVNVVPKKSDKTKPTTESPEDLEKWLDDFLDG